MRTYSNNWWQRLWVCLAKMRKRENLSALGGTMYTVDVVPSPTSTLSRWKKNVFRNTHRCNCPHPCTVLVYHQAPPIVVHSSLGIGRAGAYIALDYAMEELIATEKVDVRACVRKCRCVHLAITASGLFTGADLKCPYVDDDWGTDGVEKISVHCRIRQRLVLCDGTQHPLFSSKSHFGHISG